MTQQIIILALFLASVAYLLYVFYQKFYSTKKGCGGGCDGCAIDVHKLEKQMKESLAKKNIKH